MTSTLGRVVRTKYVDDPGLHLIAGVVACAIDDARAGSAEAWDWLRGDGRNLIGILAPAGVDGDELHALILREAGRDAATVQMSFANLITMELEAFE